MKTSRFLSMLFIGLLIASLVVSGCSLLIRPKTGDVKGTLENVASQIGPTIEALVETSIPATAEALVTQIPPTIEAAITQIPPTLEAAITEIAPLPFGPDLGNVKTIDQWGTSFLLPEAVASDALASVVPLDIEFLMDTPVELPDEYDFILQGYAIPDAFHKPVIHIYDVEKISNVNPVYAETVQYLKQYLQDKPIQARSSDGSTLGKYAPFLPFWPAAQIFVSNFNYQDFQNGKGVSYLTTFHQALYPLDNYNLFYTYQGITDDGKYYISAVLPIRNPLLPDQAPQPDDSFFDGYRLYLEEVVRNLNAQPAETFTPNRALLDGMMGTFEVSLP